MKKIVRYARIPRLGFVSIQAVRMARAIRIGTPHTMIQMVFLMACQKCSSLVNMKT
jgi:hypothetical protein